MELIYPEILWFSELQHVSGLSALDKTNLCRLYVDGMQICHAARPKIAIAFLSLFLGLPLTAQVKLSPLFSDHMVLQRDKKIPVWGTAAPGERVTVTLAKTRAEAVAGSDGHWRVVLNPIRSGGPLKMNVESASSKLVIDDVLIGDVWLASGQSNMQFQMSQVQNAASEIAAANYPQIRQFGVRGNVSPASTLDLRGSWQVSTPQNVPSFSAVAYYFARRIHEDRKVPVGIINASVGGTPIQAWASADIQLAEPDLREVTQKKIDSLKSLAKDTQQYLTDLPAWETKYEVKDRPKQDWPPDWARPDADPTPWKQASYPVSAAQLGLQGGSAVWFRKDFQVDPAFLKQPILINFGPIGEDATLYLNGKEIGAFSPPAKAPQVDKHITVPPTWLHPGTNTLAFRVFSHTPEVTLFGSGKFYLAGDSTLTLSGPWLYRIEFQTPGLSAEAREIFPRMPETYAAAVPGTLYNGMVYPLSDYPIKGILWYQGEGNVGEPALYRKVLPAMIADWRRQWGESLPFYIVQLPNYGPPNTSMEASSWPELREIQAEVGRTVAASGIAVTIDIGNADNIHPTDKLDVGDRLALLARKQVYREKLEDAGPTYKKMKISGHTIELTFDHADGLQAKGGEPKHFWIAGQDHRFYAARAVLDRKTIAVSSDMVSAPLAVRYAWTDNPEGCNLYNSSNLPAAPFRTDNWSLSGAK